MRKIIFPFLLLHFVFALCACASTKHAPEVQYYDISPRVVGSTVISESTNPAGANIITVDRYLIDKDGKVQPVKQDSASATGPVGAIVQSGISSGAATAVVGPVIGAVFPATSKTTTHVTVSK